MSKTIESNKRVRQITMKKDGQITAVRYNTRTGLLYRQNRSYDQTMSLDDFLDRLAKTKVMATKQGFKLINKFIDEDTRWAQA